jgi:hypothetical protein
LPRFTRDKNLAKTTARQRKDWRWRNKKRLAIVYALICQIVLDFNSKN